jgi:mono/diheme cytochrome c family protein
MTEPKRRRSALWPVYVVIAMIVVFSAIFVIEMLELSKGSGGADDDDLTAETYRDIVEPLLAGADASRGLELVSQYGCVACHMAQSEGRHLAPPFENVAEVAPIRREPLTAAAYVYESIIYPGAFTVEGYDGVNMPRIYDSTIPEADLGDIIAYLLSSDVTP